MSKTTKVAKTNAMRTLDQQHIKYEYTAYPSEGFMDGLSVAQAVGKPPEECFKTLVTVAASRINYVFVIPVAAELDLKRPPPAWRKNPLLCCPPRKSPPPPAM